MEFKEKKDDKTPLIEGKPEKPTLCLRLKSLLANNFLMVSLTIFLIFAIVCPQPGHALDHPISKYICIIYIFLCSGLYLRTEEMKEAILAYKAVIWGIISVIVLTSIIGGQLTKLLIPDNSQYINSTVSNITRDENPLGPIELRYGMILYSIMPCTIACGIVLVNQLNGHFALAILITVTTNMISVVTIPLYTKWMLATGANVKFDIPALLLKLVLTVLVPTIIGKCIRYIRKFREWYEQPRPKYVLKSSSSLFLVFIVWFEVSTTSLNGNIKSLSVISIVFVTSWGLLLHIIFMILNALASWILRLNVECLKCLVILCSHKAMGLAVTVMVFLPKELGELGVIAIGIIMAHIAILVFDALVIAIWLYWERRNEEKKQIII